MTTSDDAAGYSTDLARQALVRIPGYLIRRSQQVHNVIWNETLAADLTSPQYSVLSALATWPRIDQQRLGALASLDKSTVADVVTRLADRHWVVRAVDTADARRSVIDLAPAAAIALQQLTPLVGMVQQKFLAPLSPQSHGAFVSHLQIVARLDTEIVRSLSRANPLALNFDAPGHLIRRSQQAHTAIWAEEFGRELTGPQYAVLHILHGDRAINQRRLGFLAALDKSTTTDIVARLMRRGWLLRTRDPNDGRGRLLSLTDEIAQKLDAISRRVELVQHRLLEPLPEPDRPLFVRELAAIAFPEGVPREAASQDD